jgi:hypothetical protein
VQEDLAQAVTTCRRILKAVADHVLPGVRGATSESGSKLDDPAYRNRVHELISTNLSSNSVADATEAAYGGFLERFKPWTYWQIRASMHSSGCARPNYAPSTPTS